MSAPTSHLDGGMAEVVGLVVALPAEARSVGVRGVRPGGCARWTHGWVAVSGIGRHNAMRAAERLLACSVTRLANWGVAGALDAHLEPGDVLIPDRILYADNDPEGFATDPDECAYLARQLGAGLRVRHGSLWSAARPVASPGAKRALADRSGALAVDMEAAAVAAVAARANLPFVAVKAICDPSTREVPERFAEALDDGGVSWRMLRAIAFGGPATWQAARMLALDFGRARRTLATASRLATLAA